MPIKLIASDDKKPKVELKQGMTLKVDKVQIVAAAGEKPNTKIGSRLCGYSSGTCLALIEVETK